MQEKSKPEATPSTPPVSPPQEPPRAKFTLQNLLSQNLNTLITSVMDVKNALRQWPKRAFNIGTNYAAVVSVSKYDYVDPDPDSDEDEVYFDITSEAYYLRHTSHAYFLFSPSHIIYFRNKPSDPWSGPCFLNRWLFFDPGQQRHYHFSNLPSGRIFPNGIFKWLYNQNENSA